MPETAGRSPTGFAVHPLTSDRWADLEKLFGPRGAVGGCWCMWFRLPRSQFAQDAGDANRASFRELVAGGTVPGLLAYAGGEAVGWCAVEPREAYPALARSRVLAPVDAAAVWSITCFFVTRTARRHGVMAVLLRAAVAHAARQGATVVEGYPVEPRDGRIPDAFAYTGLAAAFRAAGFVEVARRGATRPIMRYAIED